MKQRFNVSMSEFLLDELDYMAEKRGMSRSAFICMLVSDEWSEWLYDHKIDLRDMTLEGQEKKEMQDENKPVYDLDLEAIREEIRDYGYPRCLGYLDDISQEKEEG